LANKWFTNRVDNLHRSYFRRPQSDTRFAAPL